jgi:peptidoglycan/LPS O-acetylase OafA/YrhL
MLVWARGRNHISGWGVIWTWLIILWCLVASALYFGLESVSDRFNGARGPFEIGVGVLCLLIAICLIAFLQGVREGGLGVLGLGLLCGIALVLSATVGQGPSLTPEGGDDFIWVPVVPLVMAMVETGYVLLVHGSEMTHLAKKDG